MEDQLGHIIAGTLGASMILFVILVMPIWIFMHYKHQARQELPPVKTSVGMSAADAADLGAVADRMEQRVSALEAIMDSEAPGWRTKS